MKNFLKYFGVLIFLLILWYFGLGYFAFLLFFMMFCLMSICILISIVPMKKTTVSLELSQEYCMRDEQINLTLYRQSNYFIDCGKIILEYQLIDVFSKLIITGKIVLQNGQTDFSITCPHCGHYIVKINKIVCFDLLQCFYFSKTVSIQSSFEVMPHYQLVNHEINSIYQLDEQGYSYSPNQKGDDYNEIFEIRQYHDGDEFKHIHWNMSSKFQELYVKVASKPIQEKLILAMEYKENSTFYDLQFDYFYSVCLFLLKENISFEIITSISYQKIDTLSVNSLENLMSVIRYLMKHPIKSLDTPLMPRSFYWIKGQSLEVYEV